MSFDEITVLATPVIVFVIFGLGGMWLAKRP